MGEKGEAAPRIRQDAFPAKTFSLIEKRIWAVAWLISVLTDNREEKKWRGPWSLAQNARIAAAPAVSARRIVAGHRVRFLASSSHCALFFSAMACKLRAHGESRPFHPASR
jgi:hypothetical protein